MKLYNTAASDDDYKWPAKTGAHDTQLLHGVKEEAGP